MSVDLKLSCADFTFPLLPHDDALKLVALLGLQGVDIGLFEDRSHIYPSHVLPDLTASARELTARVHDKGLVLADIFYFETPTVNHPPRDLFQRMVEFTMHCNTPHLTLGPRMPWYETSIKRASEELALRVELAQQAGVVCSIEPSAGSVVQTPAQTLQLLEMTPGLTLTLDYSHFAYQGISDDESEKLMPYASHFHARGANKNQMQAKLQDNVIDFPRMLRAMGETGYTGYMCLEYLWSEWNSCNQIDTLSETIQLRDLLLSVEL